MSFNLHFLHTKTGEIFDFPFQTPTETTLEVLAEKSLGLRMQIIKKAILKRGNTDKNACDAYLERIYKLLVSGDFELICI